MDGGRVVAVLPDETDVDEAEVRGEVFLKREATAGQLWCFFSRLCRISRFTWKGSWSVRMHPTRLVMSPSNQLARNGKASPSTD